MPEKKTLNEDLFYKGSSANLPRLHTCENKVPFWDFKEFAVTIVYNYGFNYFYLMLIIFNNYMVDCFFPHSHSC